MTDQEQRLADGAACLDAALIYLARGWCPLPLCPPDHVGVGKSHAHACKENSWGKAPLIPWTTLQTKLPTEEEVRSWWKVWPNANVGVIMGPLSGIIGVDLDGPAGMALYEQLLGGKPPETLCFRTPGGGIRLLYELPFGELFPNKFEHIEGHQEMRVLGHGTQTVMPPSRHRSGGYYAWS